MHSSSYALSSVARYALLSQNLQALAQVFFQGFREIENKR
jgi:hypothetical protein